jgi:hypothetical protein
MGCGDLACLMTSGSTDCGITMETTCPKAPVEFLMPADFSYLRVAYLFGVDGICAELDCCEDMIKLLLMIIKDSHTNFKEMNPTPSILFPRNPYDTLSEPESEGYHVNNLPNSGPIF